MFRFHRTARASRGKFLEAVQWSKEIASYISDNYAPVSVQAFVEQFGDTGRVHWYSDHEDLAAIEKLNAQLLADQEYGTMVNNAADLFIEGSIHDTVMQSI
jgi:hypothetical protein